MNKPLLTFDIQGAVGRPCHACGLTQCFEFTRYATQNVTILGISKVLNTYKIAAGLYFNLKGRSECLMNFTFVLVGKQRNEKYILTLIL